MANIKITDLTELTSPDAGNTYFLVTDVAANPDVSKFVKLSTIQTAQDYSIANAAFLKANTAYSTGYNANIALTTASSAFLRANASFTQANASAVTAQAGFNKANSASDLAQSAYNSGNTSISSTTASFNKANTVGVTAQSAFNKANDSFIHANSSYNLANTLNVSGATTSSTAQAAFDKANTSVIRTGDDLTGILTGVTAANGTSNTMFATTQFVNNEIEFMGKGLGYGQTWTDVKTLRASGITYTNTTGKPIMVNVYVNDPGPVQSLAYVNNVLVAGNYGVSIGGYSGSTLSFIVPAGNTYKVVIAGGTASAWAELR